MTSLFFLLGSLLFISETINGLLAVHSTFNMLYAYIVFLSAIKCLYSKGNVLSFFKKLSHLIRDTFSVKVNKAVYKNNT